jgi:hypothetical protein
VKESRFDARARIRPSIGSCDGVAPQESSAGFSVWRQDDHGRRFEVRRGLSRADAERLVGELESGGHKQSYWLEPTREAASPHL